MAFATYHLLSGADSTGAAKLWPGGRGTFAVQGTFGGATVKLQCLGPDGATWMDVGSYVTFTAAGIGGFELGEVQIRAAVSGGPPAALYANAVSI